MNKNETENNKDEDNDQNRPDYSTTISKDKSNKDSSNPEKKKHISTPFGKTAIYRRWPFWNSIIIIIITGTYSIFAFLQWQTIDEQTHNVAIQVKIMQNQLDTFNRQVNEMKEQSKLVREQIENTSKQFALENRAWVYVDGAEHTQLVMGNKVYAKLKIINSGNTPAFKVNSSAFINFRSMPLPEPMPLAIGEEKEESHPNIGPNGEFFIDISIKDAQNNDIILNDEWIKKIDSLEIRLYVWGKIDYQIIGGESHETYYCFINKPGTIAFNPCANNNTMN